MRAAWRPVRVGTAHEKADREHNERVAEQSRRRRRRRARLSLLVE